MRIGIDARLPYYRRGGISQYVIHLLPELAKLDQANEYIVWHRRSDANSYFPPDAANFHRLDALTPCHHRLERWALGVELLGHNLHTFHSPDFIPPALGADRRVITVHDLNFVHYPEFLDGESRRYYAGQIEWAVSVADIISADSEHTRQDLIDLLGVHPDKVRTVHLAANPLFKRSFAEEDIAATLATHDLKPGFILFVGTLSPRKNVPVLLQAYRRLRQEVGVETPLVLVGGAGWQAQAVFDEVSALGLDDWVRHLPGLGDQALAHLYQSAAMLALPSHYEGFGLPPLEAMHSGCPVIASDRASLPEVVGDGGILLEPDDVGAWFKAMADLLEDQERRQALTQAGFRQAARFSWKRTAQMTLALYQS